VNVALESARKAGEIKASLGAAVTMTDPASDLLTAEEWATLCIVSAFAPRVGEAPRIEVTAASGLKCERCWKVLPEVGSRPGHPTLCARCADAVDSGLAPRAAA
jgi:isoleucyl-tRNA synthetase